MCSAPTPVVWCVTMANPRDPFQKRQTSFAHCSALSKSIPEESVYYNSEPTEVSMARKKSSKKAQSVTRLRATFSKFPKFIQVIINDAFSNHSYRFQNIEKPSDMELRNKGSPIYQIKRGKSRSTASVLEVKNNISSPDNEEIVRCMAVAIKTHIKKVYAVVLTMWKNESNLLI